MRTPLYRLGVFAARQRQTVFLIWGAAALLSLVFMPGLFGSMGLPAVNSQSSEAARAADAFVHDFPLSGREQMLLVFHSDRLIATDPKFEMAMRDASRALGKQPGIVSVSWFPRAADPVARRAAAVTVGSMTFEGLPYKNPHNAYIVVGANGNDHQLLKRFERQQAAVRQAVQAAADNEVVVHFAGRTPLAHEMRSIELADFSRNEAIAVPLAFLVLLIGLGSLGSTVVPLLTAGAGIVVTVGLVALVGDAIRFDANLLLASSNAGFAVGIDYLLLLMSRYREEIRTGARPDHAAGVAIATAGRTVVCSGLIAVFAVSCLLLVDTQHLQQFSIGICTAIAMAVLASLTLGPATLVAWTPKLDFGQVRWSRGDHPSDDGLWARWAMRLIRRPWLYLLGSAAVLIALAWPALQLSPGFDMLDDLPRETSASQAMATLEQDDFAGGSAIIAVVLPRAEGQSPPDVAALVAALRAETTVASIGQAIGATSSMIAVIPRHGASSTDTMALTRRIRSDIVPATAPTGHPALVGGMSAFLADDYDEVTGKAWLVTSCVLATSFLLLMLIFRSLLIPIKAIVTNALAAAVGIGALVAIFQWGHGESLFDFQSTGSIIYSVPFYAIVLVFALSMDYEVFLVRRIQERYRATLDNDRAIAVGLQRTARPILLAAAIMVVVYAGMIPSHSTGIKQMGLTLVVVIIIDATLVRLVLVPASMKILGRWNWWLPFADRGANRHQAALVPAQPGTDRRRKPKVQMR